ncbi:MAG: trypsin-like peptidase domain-containing protein [Anaerolineae bacterium]|nr:trypsin-like peptidase domain-containing protein [Anaerolineae bacterium]
MQEPQRKNSFRVRFSAQRISALANKLLPIAVGVAVTLLALYIFGIVNPAPKPLTDKELNQRIASAMASATPPPALAARVYGAVQPSLVQVETKILSTDGKEEGGRGAGVIIDENAQILTSLHVVQNAFEIEILFMDGTRSEAQIVTTQPENDIALLKPLQMPAQFLPAILGNPNALNIGDEVFAIGSPFGLTGSESAGIVSGLNRIYRPNEQTQLDGMIQFDAAVNPGNSGGPLVNRYGEVVGIVTGLLNPSEQNFFVGIGFAVPIDTAASAAGPNPF